MNASYNYAGANPTLGPHYLTKCKSLYGGRLCLILQLIVDLSTNNSLDAVAQKHDYMAQPKKQGSRRSAAPGIVSYLYFRCTTSNSMAKKKQAYPR